MAQVLDSSFDPKVYMFEGCTCMGHHQTKETNHAYTKLDFSEEEIDLVTRMYNLVGDKWSIIAGRIPGRSAEEIEKYWISTHPSSQ